MDLRDAFDVVYATHGDSTLRVPRHPAWNDARGVVPRHPAMWAFARTEHAEGAEMYGFARTGHAEDTERSRAIGYGTKISTYAP